MARQITKWMVMAPDGISVAIEGPMGAPAIILHHMSFIYNENIAKRYPHLMVPIEEDVPDAEGVQVLLNEKTTTPVEAKPQTTAEPEKPEKRVKHGGRKKGTPNKKK